MSALDPVDDRGGAIATPELESTLPPFAVTAPETAPANGLAGQHVDLLRIVGALGIVTLTMAAVYLAFANRTTSDDTLQAPAASSPSTDDSAESGEPDGIEPGAVASADTAPPAEPDPAVSAGGSEGTAPSPGLPSPGLPSPSDQIDQSPQPDEPDEPDESAPTSATSVPPSTTVPSTIVPSTTVPSTTTSGPTSTRVVGGPLQLSNPGSLQSAVGEAVVVAPMVRGGGEQLRYSAQGLPPGLSIDPDTGVISGQPSSAGVFPARLTVSDSRSTMTQGFTWRVS